MKKILFRITRQLRSHCGAVYPFNKSTTVIEYAEAQIANRHRVSLQFMTSLTVLMIAANKVISTWANRSCHGLRSIRLISQRQNRDTAGKEDQLTFRNRVATVPPQALTIQSARTRLDNARHNVIGVMWTRIVSRIAAIRDSFIFALAFVAVEANTISSPLVGAASTYFGEGECGEEKKAERDFHIGFF